jgi:DNA-binding transcriptional regulator YiaG
MTGCLERGMLTAMDPLTQLIVEVEARVATPSAVEGREIRQRLGVTQQRVAEAVGVHWTTVARWESGQRRPRGAAASRYYDLLRRLDTL